jgi:hypothetical protein
MTMLSFGSSEEVSKITDYISYIGNLNQRYAQSLLKYNYVHAGLNENSVFSAPAPDSTSPITSWGTGTPPGGPGPCQVLQNGASFNASCSEQRHFGCEERKPHPNTNT